MKTIPRTAISLVIAGLAAAAQGQGKVNFNTRTVGTSAQVYDDPAHGGWPLGSTNYGPMYQGTNWFAQLYAAAGTGAPSSALVPVSHPVNFRSGFSAGYVQSSGTTTLGWPIKPLVTIPLLSPGGPVTLQLRAWWGGGTQITSYEAAMASSNPNSRWGASPLIYLAATGDPTFSPPQLPVDLVGLQGFQLGKTVSLTPPVIVTQPQSQNPVVGQNIILTVIASGSIPLGYQWSFNGTNIAGATTTLLALTNLQPSDAGSYEVMVTNPAGSLASSNAVVTVGPRPPSPAPPSGLVSWWRAETSANDSVGGNHGTFHNGAGLAPGKVGNAFSINEDALDFNGYTFHYVEVPNSPTLNPSASFSVEAWIYPYFFDGGHLFSKWGDQGIYANNRSYAFGTWNQGLFFYIADAAHQADTSFQQFQVTNVLTLNAWNHVAAVYDQTAGIRRLYVNGVQVGAKTNVPITVLNGSAPVRIGENNFTTPVSASPFEGLIDELSFYSEALSTSDIQAIYAAGSVGKCKDKEPPFIVTHPAKLLRVNVDTDAKFNVLATGSLTLQYQWFKDGAPLSGATDASLALASVQHAQAGIYSVQVTNRYGNTVSSNALLTVNYPPVAQCRDVVVSAAANCQGNASVNDGSFDPDGDPITITQSPLGPYPLGTNTVTLTVTDTNGAASACTAAVVVRDTTPPTISCPADIVVTNAHDQLTAIVSFSPVVSDNCSGVGLPICMPPSGSHFVVGPTVVTCSVSDASGNSNQCSFNVMVRPGNQPPVPVIEVSPLLRFPGQTNLLLLSPNNTNALVTFDGSKSYDLDDSMFQCCCYEGTNLFSTNVVATRVLAVGAHAIMLRLDDTFPLGTSSATVLVKVITPAEATGFLMEMVESADLGRQNPRPFIATLNGAAGSFGRSNLGAGANQLGAFQNKVRAQLAPDKPALAEQLVQAAQEIINVLSDNSDKVRVKVAKIIRQPDGRIRMQFTARPGQVCIVEVSTDLAHWKTIGVAAGNGDGSFQFEDTVTARRDACFYRVVSP